MHDRIARPILYGAYQLSLLVGLLLFPLAIAAGRLGVTLPIPRLIRALERAYEHS